MDDHTPAKTKRKKDMFAMKAMRYLQRRLPVLKWGAEYDIQEDLFSDIVGGVTTGMVCLAQTLAHAAIATTESIQGPYTAFVPTLAYAFFGTSVHASISSGAIAAILIADQLRPWSDIKDRTEVASLLAFISGIVLLLMGVCKMAFAVRFLSHPTLSGFITGGSIQIIVQQTRNLFGFHAFPHTSGIVSHIATTIRYLPQVDLVSLFLGMMLIALLETFNRLKAHANRMIKKGGGNVVKYRILKRCTEMKEIVVAVVGVSFGYLTARGGPGGEPTLATIGHIPSGLPSYQAPWDIPAFKGLVKNKDELASLATGGVLVALTSFLTTYATTKKMALRYGYMLDASQEMIALGMAGISGSFFRAFTPSGSLSRTGLAADCGVKTQLGGVFAAGVVALGLIFLAPTLKYMPKATLAAIIMKSTFGLIDLETPRKLMKSWKPAKKGGLRRDLVIWCVACSFTLFLGVVWGIGIAVLISILLVIKDAAEPQAVELGRVEALGRKWRNKADWPNAQTFPGILVFEFRGPLFFASAEFFQEAVEEFFYAAQDRGSPLPLSVVVLSLESVHRLDSTALSMLEDLLNEWRLKDITCIISGAKHQVRALIEEKLVRFRRDANLPPLLDQTGFMISVSDAVDLARTRLAAHKERARGIQAKDMEEARVFQRATSAGKIQQFVRRKYGHQLPELPKDVQDHTHAENLKRPFALRKTLSAFK